MSQWHRKWVRSVRLLLLGLGLALVFPAPRARAADADVELLGVASLPGTATDRSGLVDPLDADTPGNRLGGLSAIEYSGAGDLYYVLSDRGPKDGAARYICRWHTVELQRPRVGSRVLSARLVGTTLLTSADGKPYVGLSSAFYPNGPEGNRRLDPEAIRRGPSGNLYISDEYGPHVVEFDSSGHALRHLPVPSRYKIAHPAVAKEAELAANSSGRTPNGGFEGLAMGVGGHRLYALAQVPLLQDTPKRNKPGASASKAGNAQPKEKKAAPLCRLLEIDLKTRATREFAYPLDEPKNKLSEILSVDESTFLVIERDGLGGSAAACKRIAKIDLRGATDTSRIASLAAAKALAGVTPVRKSTLIDLLDPRFGIAGPHCPEKMEGLAWGPPLADGRAVLWVCVDNDFAAGAPSLFYAFAVPKL